MKENTSDRNGRALECMVSVESATIAKFVLSDRTILLNSRDRLKVLSLPETLSTQFSFASTKISQWIRSK